MVLRLRSHIARSIGDVYFVNLQLDGVGRYTQRGHEQICGPGDLAIVDTTEPFEIANCRNFSLFCFAVPRQLLPSALAERPRLRLSATDAGRALSRTLSGHAELCLHSEPNSGISAFGAQHVVDLISHAPGILEERPPERAGLSVLLSMMLDYIDRHVDDPELCAATLALKFHCSQRYVHKLFSTTGRSVGEHVNGQRILVCTRNLLDHAHRRATIAEVAGYPGIWTLIQQVKVHVDRYRQLTLPQVGRIARTIAEHEAILDAIEAHDPAAARDALEFHLERLLADISATQSINPEFFDQQRQ